MLPLTLLLMLLPLQTPASGGAPKESLPAADANKTSDTILLARCDRAYQHAVIDRDAAQKALAASQPNTLAPAGAALVGGGTGIGVASAICAADGKLACLGGVGVGLVMAALGFHWSGAF